MWRASVVGLCEGARFLVASWRWRHEPQMRNERAFTRYLMRCAWQDLTAPFRPHSHCWLCGDPVRRWWGARPCGCEADADA